MKKLARCGTLGTSLAIFVVGSSTRLIFYIGSLPRCIGCLLRENIPIVSP